MKILVQRSLESSVSVNNKTVGKIDKGMVIFVGFSKTDGSSQIEYLINKILNLRIFDDENGIMNKSILDVNGKILSISQFTLYADTRKGNRPSYINSMNHIDAEKLYNEFNQKLSKYITVETGIFRSDMRVNITNDGPITIILERN
mgnify:FL=1